MLSDLIHISFTLALLIAGWWLSSLNGWYLWGVAVMIVASLAFIKKIFIFLAHAFEATHQINLLHESRTISNEYGHARLASAHDNFVKKLTNGFYIGSLGAKPLFYDPFESGNDHMLTYAPSRTGKTISAIIPALMHWLVTDIKGELTAITASYRRSRGENVLIFNPRKISWAP